MPTQQMLLSKIMENKLSNIYGQRRGVPPFWALHLFQNLKKYFVEFPKFCPIKKIKKNRLRPGYFEGKIYPKPHLFLPSRNLSSWVMFNFEKDCNLIWF